MTSAGAKVETQDSVAKRGHSSVAAIVVDKPETGEELVFRLFKVGPQSASTANPIWAPGGSSRRTRLADMGVARIRAAAAFGRRLFP